MSFELHDSNVEAKTGIKRSNGEQYVLLEGLETTMTKTVVQIGQTMLEFELLKDPNFSEFIDYLKSMYPQPDEDEQFGDRLVPAIRDFTPAQDRDPRISIFGYELTRGDFMEFTNYVLTNTPIDGGDDPRLTFLEKLRAGLLDQQEVDTSTTPFTHELIKERTDFDLVATFTGFARNDGEVSPDLHEYRERLSREHGEGNVLSSFYMDESGKVQLGLFIRMNESGRNEPIT